MSRLRRSSRGRGRGQALTEFAIILPIFLLLIMGIVDFGRAIVDYSQVSNAAREAARTGIVDQNTNDIAAKAAQQAGLLGLSATPATGCPSPDGPTSKSGGTCVSILHSDLSTDCSASPEVGCVVDVSVKYTFTAITPIISNIIGPITLTSTSRETIEYLCSSGCQPR